MRKKIFTALLFAMVIVGGISAQEPLCDRLFLQAVREEKIGDVELHLSHDWGNLNARDNGTGKTGLMYAIEAGNLILVEYLINPPARANVRNPKNSTSNPNIEDNHGKTALIYAIEKGNDVILSKLLSIGSITINYRPERVSKRRTALHHAVLAGWNDGVRILLDKGADANMQDSDGITPFMLVLQEKKLSLIEEFKDRPGFDITLAPRNSAPPLLYALQNGMAPEIIQKILVNFDKAMGSRFNQNGPLQYLEIYRSKYDLSDYTDIKVILETENEKYRKLNRLP